MSAHRGVARIEILHVPDCPLVEEVRETVRRSLATAGCAAPVEELEGDYPSPSLLVNGIDVVTGRPPADHAACRRDLPTDEQVLAALEEVSRS